MQGEKILFDDGNHKCILFRFDDESADDSFLAVNQYLIVQNGLGVLLDPGGKDIYDDLYKAICRHIKIENLRYIFFSHQDPDVADSISHWAVSTSAKLLVSSIWTRFMGHYGLMDMNRLYPIYDKGARIELSKEYLDIIPAHFLHSAGNFSLYDAHSKILFSGDIAASVSPFYDSQDEMVDFETYKKFAEGFHRRYMAGNSFCKAWVKAVIGLEINMIAPQHGTILSKSMSESFLKWFQELQCGGDLMEELY